MLRIGLPFFIFLTMKNSANKKRQTGKDTDCRSLDANIKKNAPNSLEAGGVLLLHCNLEVHIN